MTRPQRDPAGVATVKITVRLPEATAATWRASAAASRLTLSDWLRLAAAQPADVPAGLVARRPPRRRAGVGVAVPPPVDPAVVVQLVRIGSNLNQIARVLNATGGPADLGTQIAITAISRQIDRVLSAGLPAPDRQG